ncbi:phosphomannose isomerase type II C-terminal cupin domain [Planomonospora sp. ID67723]|uniref:phosphomannose isomerase type II C-terminal cupin domain n=1 Tax=Planomonospora sp. ID67723 TaxID=2738134 RepID=UPI0018C3F8B0|nr:phosphomannose isomerase type II C-terminal cupin domain [Planomonospora sp. ID67723]MBG0828874.1 phosphomannose isomerase type II C-terminal cupin domain [Planomonospora sp. ID67723]
MEQMEGILLEVDRLGAVVRDERPWGGFERYTLNEPTTVKIIEVAPGQRLSLQRHEHRDELWVALDPGAVFEIDGIRTEPAVGDRVLIRAGQTHRLGSSGPATRILEIAFGYFDEDDIERLEDSYGRA